MVHDIRLTIIPGDSPPPTHTSFEYFIGIYSNVLSFFVACSCRFVVGCYEPPHSRKYKTHIRSQFLSPQITYAVNFIFKCIYRQETKQLIRIAIKYRLEGETKTSIVYLADEREDEWLMAELYQFTSDGTTVDLEIIIDHDNDPIVVEGIEFQPLERVS